MKAQLEAIAQTLVEEMKTTGTITLDGKPSIKGFTTNPSPCAGLCGPAFDKFAEIVKYNIPESKIDKLQFSAIHPRQPQHVIAEVTTKEGVFKIDTTLEQYISDVKSVYSEEEQYPLKIVPGSEIRTTIYDGLN
tara:strand:- start:34 stop:435 length:402 start_codon:yes stop_codon:yes gene_type:complete